MVIEATWWPILREAVDARYAGQEWPVEAMAADLAWERAEEAAGRGRVPGRPTLMKRWRATDHRVKTLLGGSTTTATTTTTSDPPADRQPTASRPPAVGKPHQWPPFPPPHPPLSPIKILSWRDLKIRGVQGDNHPTRAGQRRHTPRRWRS